MTSLPGPRSVVTLRPVRLAKFFQYSLLRARDLPCRPALLATVRQRTKAPASLQPIRLLGRGAILEELQQLLAEFRRILVTMNRDGMLHCCARLILGTLEGAMPVAHSYGDERRFRATAENLLAEMAGEGRSTQRKASLRH